MRNRAPCLGQKRGGNPSGTRTQSEPQMIDFDGKKEEMGCRRSRMVVQNLIPGIYSRGKKEFLSMEKRKDREEDWRRRAFKLRLNRGKFRGGAKWTNPGHVLTVDGRRFSRKGTMKTTGRHGSNHGFFTETEASFFFLFFPFFFLLVFFLSAFSKSKHRYLRGRWGGVRVEGDQQMERGQSNPGILCIKGCLCSALSTSPVRVFSSPSLLRCVRSVVRDPFSVGFRFAFFSSALQGRDSAHL